MNISCLLIGINAKYIHTNLAIRYLYTYGKSQGLMVDYTEFSINDNLNKILKNIVNTKATTLAFSCYIWNIDIILKLVNSLKSINPNYKIILGGPEVSFDSKELLSASPIDFIIKHEGEIAFCKLISAINSSKKYSLIEGLSYRENGQIYENPNSPLIDDLDLIPFPYSDFNSYANKIIYYETSRGCPFNCKYCLSSTLEGVRYFTLDRVKKEIKQFTDANVAQVKLVDRTFNCHKKRCVEIMQYIISLNANTNFHFEISADIVDDEFINVLNASNPGTFQLEIGVQSTNPKTLDEIDRKAYFNTISENILKLLATKKAHIHLDLIAGLPFEDLESFKKSFNETIALKPQMLQLGFLKLLKGSRLRSDEALYDYKYHTFAPYEIISCRWLSYSDILHLKDIEELLELYHNSGRFTKTFNYINDLYQNDLWRFFDEFQKLWNAENLFEGNRNVRELYKILYSFLIKNDSINIKLLKELFCYDFIINNFNLPLPSYLSAKETSLPVDKWLKDKEFIEKNFKFLSEKSFKDVRKNLRYETFHFSIDKLCEEREYVIFFTQNQGITKITPF